MSEAVREPAAARLVVTTILAHRPRPGRQDELHNWADAVVVAASAFPGFLGAQVLPPTSPVRPELVLAFSFDDHDRLAVWEASPVRAELVARLRELVADTRMVTAGELESAVLGTSGAARTPPRWKSAGIVLAGAYPVSLLLGATLVPLLAHWPTALRTLVVAATTVVLLLWVCVPLLTRLLARWLQE